MDDRISVEAEASGPRLPRPLLIGLGVVGAALLGFIFTADIGQPDDTSTTSSLVVASTADTTTTSTAAVVSPGLRARPTATEVGTIDWTPIDLPESADAVAGLGSFQGEVVAIVGNHSRGFVEGLSLYGLSAFESWYSIGAITTEPIVPEIVEISERAVVVVGRSFPTTESPLGEIVVLHSLDGVEWHESRIADDGMATLVFSVAVERDAISVYGARASTELQQVIAELPPEYQELIGERLAYPAGFDGDIIVFGPFGMELARFQSSLVPQGSELVVEDSFVPTAWRGPFGGDLAPYDPPFSGGFADAVREDDLGDLVAQVFRDDSYEEWRSTGNGTWELVAADVGLPGRAVGGLGQRSLYLNDVSVSPRVVMIDGLVGYVLDFDQPALNPGAVFSTPAGVVVSADTFEEQEPPQSFSYTDGPWTITITQAGLMTAQAGDGRSISRLITGVWPVEYNAVDRTLTVANLTGTEGAVLDMGLLVQAERVLQPRTGWSYVFVSRDLDEWSISILDRQGPVATAAVAGGETYVVVADIDEFGEQRDYLYSTTR